MRNFDEMLAKDREFTVRGEKFRWNDVRPEVLTLFQLSENGDSESETYVWRLLDAQIMLFIDPEQHERWKELRARETDPVTIAQLEAILAWLMEEQTGRPLQQPSPSAPGRGKTAASSKGA